MPHRHVWLRILALFAILGLPGAARAQSSGDGVFVNGETERYLRVLQDQGEVPLYPWSIRSFSRREARRLAPGDSLHPWQGRRAIPDANGAQRHIDLLPVEGNLIFNSAFPVGDENGPVWAGRGVTAAVQLGFAAEYGPVSLTVAPQAFWAQNRSFTLAKNGSAGRLAFADPRSPATIDLPQRFGNDAYARIDPGQSTLRIDGLGATLGISTANQQWGPSISYPLLLGSEAPGFPHVFLGTEHPVNIGIGRVHARMIWGKLSHSDYSPLVFRYAERMGSGVVVAFRPRGVDGLEIGGGRFVHSGWPDDPLSRDEITRPLGGLFSESTPNGDENGLASIFARWVFPKSGFEIFGEYLRDDFTWTFRHLEIIADENSGYTLGFQKAWRTEPGDMYVVRGEVVNARTTPDSPPGFRIPLYVHSPIVQGHTNRGQPLGSLAAYWGAGSNVAVERYNSRGRLTLEWTRRTAQTVTEPGAAQDEGYDALHTLGLDAVWFRRGFDLQFGLKGGYELNRNFGGDDAFNFGAQVGARWSY